LYNVEYLGPPDWEVQVDPGSPGDDFVDVDFFHDAELGQNESASLTVSTINPGTINWANNPSATTTIPCTVTADSPAFDVGVGSLTQVDAPLSDPERRGFIARSHHR
jgi:hypothetical protein